MVGSARIPRSFPCNFQASELWLHETRSPHYANMEKLLGNSENLFRSRASGALRSERRVGRFCLVNKNCCFLQLLLFWLIIDNMMIFMSISFFMYQAFIQKTQNMRYRRSSKFLENKLLQNETNTRMVGTILSKNQKSWQKISNTLEGPSSHETKI